MSRTLVLILTLYLFCLKAWSQQLKATDFDLYTTEQGLSDDNISGIVQDSTGYLWISTNQGLNRFDGSHFIPFHANDDSTSLPAEFIDHLSWADSYRLAVISIGLQVINMRTSERRNLFIPYHDKKYQFKFNVIRRVKGDSLGHLFVLTRSGFYHFDENYQLVSRFDYHAEEDVPFQHFFFGDELLELDSRRFLITSIGGFFIYDKATRKVTKMKALDCPLMNEFSDFPKHVYYFFQLQPGEFFICKGGADSMVYVNLKQNRKIVSTLPFTLSGPDIGWRSKLLRLSNETFLLTGHHSGIYRFKFDARSGHINFQSAKELPDIVCTSIAKDRQHNLLLGTKKGLLRQRLPKPVTVSASMPPAMQQRFPNLLMDDVYPLGARLYVASRDAGLLVFDRNSLQFLENLSFPQFGEGATYIRSIVSLDSNTLLLGTHGPLIVYRVDKKSARTLIPSGWKSPEDWTNDLYKDAHNQVWIASRNLYRLDIATGKIYSIPILPSLLETPFGIAGDQKGNAWIACHGIARYNVDANKYDLYLDSFPFIRMPDKEVDAITVDDRNRVWFTSHNNGLIVYDPKDRSFRLFTQKDGLPGDAISSLILVGHHLWIAAYAGIASIDINTFEINSFGKEDGFPTSPIIQGSRFFLDEARQLLYIGFTTAVARFNPAELLKRRPPPQVFLEQLVLNGRETHYLPKDQIELNWRDRELRFSIGSINFLDGNTERYAYRIDGNDTMPWIDLAGQSSFSVSRLSPGQHRLQVKVSSATKRWPVQIRELTLIQNPPFWLSGWFITLLAGLVGWLVYALVNWRSSVARRKEMAKTQLEKLRAEDYKAQFELEQITTFFTSSLVDKKSEEEVLWDVAANLIGRMNYEDCIIYRWNSSRTKMLQKAAFGPKGRLGTVVEHGFEVAPGQGIVGHVIQTHRSILVPDTRIDKRYRVDDCARLSELAVPILYNDELIGVIDSENSAVGFFTERDVKMLTTIATLLANKLVQVEAEQALELKRQELQGINLQLAEARLSALQAQMNPHFVFNALNSIKRMILDRDNENASRYLSKFASMIRMTMEQSKETFVSVKENNEYLLSYLDMERLRFDGGFDYTIEVADDVDLEDALVPSMMIQPLVENAIWHGLQYVKGERRLSLLFTQDKDRLTCTIDDNGIGIKESALRKSEQRPMHRSEGLTNLRRRIKIINEKYQTECTLSISDLKDAGHGISGTRAILQMKLINN